MFTNILKISIFIIIFFVASCGIKSSWEESGKYTVDKSLPSTYIWKKGKQYVAIVSTIPVEGNDLSIVYLPLSSQLDLIPHEAMKNIIIKIDIFKIFVNIIK